MLCTAPLCAERVTITDEDAIMYSSSVIDWTKDLFTSTVNLDVAKAGIKMPSGKNSAINQITTELPTLIKDPLLSLYVNSETQLGDLVLSEQLTLEQITNIIDEGKRTPGVFAHGGTELQTIHTINVKELSSLLIQHRYPYTNPKPIEQTASRAYTGIIIDARGTYSVHGEFTKDSVYPCFFPRIWDSDMNLIYEKNMGEPDLEKTQGLVSYDWSDNEKRYRSRVGIDPLHITARKVYGRLRTDPVISREDALKILTIPENLELLKQGKVVILLDKDNLIHPQSAPDKDESYYMAYRQIKQYLFENEEEMEVSNGIPGIQIRYNLKFVPDSATLLESELPKLKTLAAALKKINADNAFTILVEGHTADVHKPEGQMRLSIQRTQTIINELVKNGLDRSIFSYRGYGGTMPEAPNDTPEGRAQNRRVIITARPKATYIQRK